MELIFLILPWLGVWLFLALIFRNPPSLRERVHEGGRELPFVSIIVPARNEEANIRKCLASLVTLDYPGVEVLVIDDQSQDRTRQIVEEESARLPSKVRLIRGKPLPEGWFGKPWACWQGAQEARGALLLFTDADTVHSPDLLARAVRGMTDEGADVLTVIGRQVMDSFWEQLIQPQFFMLLAGRFPRVGVPKRPQEWRQAISNGQYLLFTREAYETIGGHEAVAGEVAEDLRMAQILVRGGWKLVVRGGEEGLQTRMYQSLGDLVEGWSKNVATGALQSTVPWLLPVILPFSLLAGITLWLLPPGALVWSLATGQVGTLLVWAATATGLSVMIWVRASVSMKGNPLYGFLYPLGAGLGGYIFVRSWWRGTRIEWKGREYEMPHKNRVALPSVTEGQRRARPGRSKS